MPTLKRTPPMSTAPSARYYVFGAGHAFLGSFGDADEAHSLTHDTSRQPHTRLPLDVADLDEQTNFFVHHFSRREGIRRLTATVGVPANRSDR
jgi:hypothetical protein